MHIRTITLISTLVYCMWFFFSDLPIHYPNDLLGLLSLDGAGAYISPSYSVLGWGSFIVRIAAMIGLFFYVRPAVVLFAFWLATTIALSALGGVAVLTAADFTVGHLSSLLDGVLLALAYLYVWKRTENA